MNIAICYYSATGRTAAMAQAVAAGIVEFAPDCTVRTLHIDEIDQAHPDNVAFVNEADGVIFGTPDYYAGECWQIKKWLDVCPCKLAGKLAGVFATANFAVGGPVVAIEHIVTHLLVQGCMVYSGGSAYGQPIIHLGPVCIKDHETDGTALMQIFGQRFAQQLAAVVR